MSNVPFQRFSVGTCQSQAIKVPEEVTRLLMAMEAAPLAAAEDYNGSDQEKWWTENTVAVVAGSSRGIGLETVRHLAKQCLTVVLTARNNTHGLAIAKSVIDEGYPNVHFHQLDVQSDQSVLLLADWIKNKFGGIDILINNFGVIGAKIDWNLWESRGISRLGLLANRSFIEGFSEDYNTAKACVDINYFGAKRMVKALLPLLKPSSTGSRIVNVSSLGGLLQHLGNETLRMQLNDVENLSEETIDGFINMYLNDEKSGDIEGKGWPPRLKAYIVSKIALNAYTRLLARDLQKHDHLQAYWDGIWKSTIDQLSMSGIQRHGDKDLLLWTVSNFRRPVSVQDIYRFMNCSRAPYTLPSFPHRFWKAKCPPKIIYFAWLVFYNKNLTWDNLRKRFWHGPSRCTICKADEESNLHMFFKCPVIQQIWYVLSNLFDFILTDFDSTSAALIWWSNQQGNRRFLILIFLWSVWKWRNDHVFNDSARPSSTILDNIMTEWLNIYGT